MALIYFKCNCGNSQTADEFDAGRQIQCSECGRSLIVPSPEVYWKCSCGEEMSAPKNIEGGMVQCAVCEAKHAVPVRLGLKRGKQTQHELISDVPPVPVGRTNEVRCPKCGYMSPPVLMLCPQCQTHLHKGVVIRRQCIAAAKVIVVIGLGWFLAANFTRIGDFVKGLLGREMLQGGAPVELTGTSGNVINASTGEMPASK